MADVSLLFNIIGRDFASPALKKVGAEAEATGGLLGKMGKGLAVLGIAGAAAKSLKAAGDFQQSTNILVTAAGETQANLGKIRTGIEGIAASTGTSLSQLSSGMYMVEKAGFRGADGLLILKAAAQGAREEGADLATVTNAMTSVMNSYHLKASQSVSVMNQLKTAAGESKTTMENFAGALSTVLPIASANKVSFADVAGAMATLTSHGTSADEATQELANTIRNLAAPNNVARKAMASLGISADDVSQHLGDRGMTGTLDLLSETVLSKMGPSGMVLLKTFNQSKEAAGAAQTMFAALPPAVQKVAQQFREGTITAKDWTGAVKSMTPEQANLAKQWAVVENKSAGFNDQLKQGLSTNKTYTKLIKDMTGGVNGLNTTLQITGESTEKTKERVKAVADSAKAAGDSVEGWESTQKLFNVQLDIFKQRLAVASVKIGTALLPAGIALAHVFGGVAGVLSDNAGIVGPLAIALVGFATAVWTVNKAVVVAKATQKAYTTVIALFSKESMLAAAATKVWAGAQWLLNVAMDANPFVLAAIGIVALGVVLVAAYKKSETFRKIVTAAFHAVTAVATAAFNWIKGHWPLVAGILAGPIGLAVAEIIKHWQGIRHAFDDAVGWAKALPGRLIAAIGNLSGALLSAGRDFVMGFVHGVTDAIPNALSAVGNMADSAVNWAKSRLHINSPSRVMMKVGSGFTEGFAIGVTSSTKKVTDAVSKMLDAAKQRLDEAKTFAAGIRDSFTQAFDLSSLDMGDSPGLASLMTQLQTANYQANAFAQGIEKLRAMGLNEAALGQLRDAGPKSGYASEQALLSGGAGDIQRVNSLVNGIASAGSWLGDKEARKKFGVNPNSTKVTVKTGKLHVSFDFTKKGAENALVEAIRQSVRARGGDVQVVFGK